MPIVRIDARQITGWNSFHTVFRETFGFARFYGCNMNAWIDCMSYLDDPDADMTTVYGDSTDPVVLHIDHVDSLTPEIYESLVDCSSFVNWRRIEVGESAILCLSFYRTSR